MYGRDYEGKTLQFEPSGGLANGALILQDKETDTYWSRARASSARLPPMVASVRAAPVRAGAGWCSST